MPFAARLGLLLVLAMELSAPSEGWGGQFNSQLDIGDAAPAWTNLPGVDGKQHSSADLNADRLVVVVFTANSCDVATDYEDRIIAFAKKHKNEVSVVAINVSVKPADSLAHMKRRAVDKKLPYPYLFDESQAVGKAYGANFTPEFFLLNARRRMIYMGSMDDSTYADRVQEQYLEAAVTAALKVGPLKITETAPRGCRIRYRRTRPAASTAGTDPLLIEEQQAREHVRRNPPPTLSE